MKKLLLTFIYPFWFFFGKTWFGNVIMIPIVLCLLPILMSVVFPSLNALRGDEAQSVGMGIGVLSLMCAPYTAVFFMRLSHDLEKIYKKWKYKTEIQ